MGALAGVRTRGAAEGVAVYLVLWVVIAIGLAAFDDEAAGDPIVDGLRVMIAYALAVLALARTAMRTRIRRPD